MTMTTTTNYGVQRAATASAASIDAQSTEGDVPATALLPEPAASGLCDGSIAELAMLLTKVNEQDRTASRQIEDAANQAATQEENDRAAQMQAKASADQSQALASGIGEIAQGLCTAAGGFSDEASPGRERFEGAAQGAHGLGDLFAAQGKGDAGRADAAAAMFEARAQAEIRRYTQAQEDAQAANESIQKVDQFLDQIQQTENATRLSAATYRG